MVLVGRDPDVVGDRAGRQCKESAAECRCHQRPVENGRAISTMPALRSAEGMPYPCSCVGHLEAVAGGCCILAWYRAHGGDPLVTSTPELTRLAEDGAAA